VKLAWRGLAWPMRVVVVALAAALITPVKVAVTDGPSRDALIGLGMWIGYAAMAASGMILFGTAIQRMRKRPLAISDSRVPRLLAVTGGVAMTSIAALLTTFAVMPVWLAIGAVSAGLAVIAWRIRVSSVRASLVLLIVAIALFDVPRELGYISFTRYRASWTTKRSVYGGVPACAPPPADARHFDGRALDGNLGDLVFPGDAPPAAPVVRFEGTVDAGWIGCHLPWHKELHIRTSIVATYDGIGCQGSAGIDLDDELDLNGIASCDDARGLAAQHIAEQLRGALDHL